MAGHPGVLVVQTVEEFVPLDFYKWCSCVMGFACSVSNPTLCSVIVGDGRKGLSKS